MLKKFSELLENAFETMKECDLDLNYGRFELVFIYGP